MLDTSNPNNYAYLTRHLEIHILGGIKTGKLESLRVTISIQRFDKLSDQQHNVLRHSIDLYNDNQIERFTRKIAERLEIGTSVARRTLQELTKELENHRFLLIDQYEKETQPYHKELSATEEKQAIQFLEKPDLLKRTNGLIGKSGVIGEETNRQTMFLIFTSRKTNNPLHCISLGSSGTGKTHLQSAITALMPEEDVIEVTNLSANALYYFAQKELSHKAIVIEDLDGAASVLYTIRELASKKTIKKRVAHKDKTGNTKTIELIVEGPVCIAGATTQENIYEDNANRSFLLYIDESCEQDQKIMDHQRAVSAGQTNEQEQLEARQLLQNAQRLLKPVKVVNPYAMYLSLPSAVFKPRRTNSHYLQFIEAITFYKQWQRHRQYDKDTGEEFIETTIEDIQEANELIIDVLLRKSDTLTGATRNYLEELKKYLVAINQTTFTAFEIRRKLKVKKTTQWRYHQQLLDNYYIKKVKAKGENLDRYEVTDPNEYKELEESITQALQECLIKINTCQPDTESLSRAKAMGSSVPGRSTTKVERLTATKTES